MSYPHFPQSYRLFDEPSVMWKMVDNSFFKERFNMKLEIFKSSYGYDNFRMSGGKPTEEMLNYLKENGYRWSGKNKCWYPATSEAKAANLHEDFVTHFKETFFPEEEASQPDWLKAWNERAEDDSHLNRGMYDNDSDQEILAVGADGDAADREIEAVQKDERIVYLEDLIAELREGQRRDQEKIAQLEDALQEKNNADEVSAYEAEQEQIESEAEWEKENALTDDEENAIIGKSQKVKENLSVSPEELSLAKSVLPSAQYDRTLRLAQGEESEFFKKTLKDIARRVEAAPKIGGTDGAEQHPIVLRYFHPSGSETLVTEIGKNGEAYGYQVLNGDYEMSEWGYIDLNEIKGISGIEVDFHVPDGMTVEKWLYQESPENFPQYAKFAGNETLHNETVTNDDEISAAKDISFAIYQVKETADELATEDELRAVRFSEYKDIKRRHYDVKRERYNKVYESSLSKLGVTGNIDDKEVAEMLAERIFDDFNTKIPEDFHGHSLSVSDIIVMEQDERKIPFFVDGFGFVSDAIDLEQFIDDDREFYENSPLASLTKEEKRKFTPRPVTLEEILNVMDMRIDISDDGKIMVYDTQRNEYIDSGREDENGKAEYDFVNAEDIFERLDTYINDYFTHDMEEQLEAVGVDSSKTETLSELCDLYKAELEKGNENLSEDELNLALGIVHPDTVILPEIDRHVSVAEEPDEYGQMMADAWENFRMTGLELDKNLADQEGLTADEFYEKHPDWGDFRKTTKSDMKRIREQCREILEKPDSEITEADKRILAQYEGAGGVDEENRTNAGILNEFYTPNNLVEKVWQIVDAYAPNARTVLEPSAGVGKFATGRPNNEFTMHELDETSARINKILHPEATVIQGAFQKQFFDEGERFKKTDYEMPKYDVVIGNPPYGVYSDKYKGLGEGKEFDRYEEYFIAKGLDSLKDENSVMAFVVPSGFLNSANDKAKQLIAEKGELIDAYRLPVGTFPTTEVGTDIIIMRSWEKRRKDIEEYNKTAPEMFRRNFEKEKRNMAGVLSNGDYFDFHTDKVLGEIRTRTNRFGKEEKYVAVHDGLTVQDELNKIPELLTKNFHFQQIADGQMSVESKTEHTVSNQNKTEEIIVPKRRLSNLQSKAIKTIQSLYNNDDAFNSRLDHVADTIRDADMSSTDYTVMVRMVADFDSDSSHYENQKAYDEAVNDVIAQFEKMESLFVQRTSSEETATKKIISKPKKLNRQQIKAIDNIRFIMQDGTMMRVLDEHEQNRLGEKFNSFYDRLGHITHVIRDTDSKELVSEIAGIDFSDYKSNPAETEKKIIYATDMFAMRERAMAAEQEIDFEKEDAKVAVDATINRPKKERWNIAKSKGEVMTAEEFSRLYGRDFDEREFPIWKATDWQGNIDLSKLSVTDMLYMEQSGNYVVKGFDGSGKTLWTHSALFASGDIYAKIEEQKRLLAQAGERTFVGVNTVSSMKENFEKNIALLESVKKPPLDISRIHFGSKAALAEEFKIPQRDADGNPIQLNLQESFILWAQNASLSDEKYSRWEIDFATANISREELGEEIGWGDIINYIEGKPVKADRAGSWETRNMDEAEKEAFKAEKKKEADLKRQQRADTANRIFDRYLHEGLDDATRARLEAEYNRRFNSYIAPDYSKLPLFVDGMSAYKGDSKFKLYDQQIKGISFLCNKGNGLLAYDVGVGKTAAGIVATVNQIQTGRSKRPLIVVPNQVYSKWYTDIRQLFPDMKVNDLYNFNKDSIAKYVDSKNPHKLNIPENSISLCTYEALKNITFTDQSCENELFSDFANLLSVDFDKSERENAKDTDKIKNTIGAGSQVKNANYVFFEQCGFDNLTVDEAHNFKNLWVVPRPKNKGESNEYAGIPSGKPSARALKMYGMTQLVQRHNDDRNVFMLTATPFTNSPTEVYSMLSYIGRERLKEAGITSLRAFFDEFAQTKQELGVTGMGNIDTKQVMKNWKSLPALQSILTEFIDKVDGEEAGIIRPNKFTHVKPLDMSPLQKEMREIDEERMAEVRAGNSAAVIVAMNNMRLACVAPALANPAMYPGVKLPPFSELVETSPKLKFVCDAIIDMYRGNPEKGQFMYVPLGKESHGIIKDYLVKHGIPKDAVEIINGDINNTVEKKEKITSRFNDEKNPCKIIIGGKNTAEGIDLNGNSFVMYNCSLGWNPSETIQAEGRIWRQGNLQGNVHIVYPVMNDSIDSVLYQKHDEKRSRINELWSYKGDSLNVEDINPEDLKLDLIKDPQKRAKLILQEETKETRAELAKLKLKIKSFDDIIEKRKQLELDFTSASDMTAHYEKQIQGYKEAGLSVPEWIKTALKDEKKKFDKTARGKSTVEDKLLALGIKNDDDVMKYIRNLNAQKKACNDKIKHTEETLPEIIAKLRKEQAAQKATEYPVEKQREILEADILSNLRPMKEVEYEIKTMRFEAMIAEKLKAGDITQDEHDLYKKAGYEKYELWQNGEIESLDAEPVVKEQGDRHVSVETAIPKFHQVITYSGDIGSDEKLEYETLSEAIREGKEYLKSEAEFYEGGWEGFGVFNLKTKKIEHTEGYFPIDRIFTEEIVKLNSVLQKTTKSEQKQQSIYEDEGSLFFGLGDDVPLAVHSPEQPYFNAGNDDIHLTPTQLTESEQKRDKIVLPILAGKEMGMYKAFNDFAKRGVFDVVGTKIDLAGGGISAEGWNQLHAAMNIYRSKEFETMRYVLIDKKSGEIRDQLAVSSKMPNQCSFAGDIPKDTIQSLITRAEETDSLIVAVHNHPSGNVSESKQDVEITNQLKHAFTNRLTGETLFAGHIILDHDTFNVYTPEKGWGFKLDWERVNTEDTLVRKDFAFADQRTDDTFMLKRAAEKINDTTHWNDDFIPVLFANEENEITGVKLYDTSFFSRTPQAIRNEFQFSGVEAGAVKAFPVITEHLAQKMPVVDAMLLEDTMKNLVRQNAFTDAALPDSTIVEKYGMKPGIPFYSEHDRGKTEITSTWQTRINPTLFEQFQQGTLRITQIEKEPFHAQEKLRMKKAVCIGY